MQPSLTVKVELIFSSLGPPSALTFITLVPHYLVHTCPQLSYQPPLGRAWISISRSPEAT